MSYTHSQVITLTGIRQSGVTTSLLEHVEKSLKANPGKIALLTAYDPSMVAMLNQLIKEHFPNIVENVIVSSKVTLDQLRGILAEPPEEGYCGVFADDGYHYLSHEGLMSIAREFPLLDIAVGDSKDDGAEQSLGHTLPLRGHKLDPLLTADNACGEIEVTLSESGSDKETKCNDTPYNAFRATLLNDSGYAWGWQCNLAMLIKDTSNGAVGHRTANVAAAEFMKRAFDVDVTKFKEWMDFERQWSNSGKPVKYLLNMDPTLSILLDNGMVKEVGKVNWDFYSLVGDYLTITDRSEFEIELELYSKILTEWHLQQGTRSICEE